MLSEFLRGNEAVLNVYECSAERSTKESGAVESLNEKEEEEKKGGEGEGEGRRRRRTLERRRTERRRSRRRRWRGGGGEGGEEEKGGRRRGESSSRRGRWWDKRKEEEEKEVREKEREGNEEYEEEEEKSAEEKSAEEKNTEEEEEEEKPFIVTTDASQYGIGAVLAQQDGKKLRPIEYMSKKMPSKKLAKSTYERELYALYKVFVHWRHFLLGRFFYLRTDHQTLKWIKTQPALSDALKRWIEVIDQYDFKLEYLKGEYNKVADALSRRADYLGALVSDFGISEEVTQSLVGAYHEDPVMMDIIRKLQVKDKATERLSVSMDFMDTLVTSKSGKRHIFVIIDRFTKYARLIPMPETGRTEYVIKLFKDNLVRDFGLPKTIISDRDVRFTSELWKKTAEQMGSQLQMT
ncbi:hypothetical protein CBR_g49285 [Chara braunii]|uniref:Integrase catalytic domain-containing protein n=1 Tax=Chara braunii TaxID=69332 RepID=A0A388M4H6_CHABU|nr:hypothetical protein CBR_g49285 [Chara braunii]|eukprot:GBG89494.1 hypothetical protein CBR_g49285 [Chara braunii]